MRESQKKMKAIARKISAKVINFWEQVSFNLLDRVVPSSLLDPEIGADSAISVEEDSYAQTDEISRIPEDNDAVSEAEKLYLHSELSLGTLKRWYQEPKVLKTSVVTQFSLRDIQPKDPIETNERGTKRKSPDEEDKVEVEPKRRRGRQKAKTPQKRRRVSGKKPTKVEVTETPPVAEPSLTSVISGLPYIPLSFATSTKQTEIIRRIDASFTEPTTDDMKTWEKIRGKKNVYASDH